MQALGGKLRELRAEGRSPEDVARLLHAERREIGRRYKRITPAPARLVIWFRNLLRYGDPLGPSIDWMREAGKTWEQISESACRPGGRGLPF